MEAKALSARELFDGTVCYEIPPFQRPYVWTEEDQWQPLWDDIERVVERESEGEAASPHFLGAVVVKQLPAGAGDPARHSVIDGQQRLTTLQVLLDAIQLIASEHGDEDDAETLNELVWNPANRFRNTHKRFKLRPSRLDREAFERVMDNDLSVPPEMASARIVQAHSFFYQAVRSWAEVTGDPDKARTRIGALAAAVQQRLLLVSIDLGTDDDDQLIFETLNDRGTPLLSADLIKNFIFLRGEEINADVDRWGEQYWNDFDEDWWREEVSQGRLYRSRIDLFLQYWLTMRLQEEIPTDRVFQRFRAYASPHLVEAATAEALLAALRQDANTFRGFAQLDNEGAPGRFYRRVIEKLELGATTPVLLWLISDNHQLPAAQVAHALSSLESWVVRRTLLRWTMKDVNKMTVALLKHLATSGAVDVGDTVTSYLLDQTADARVWPDDDVTRSILPRTKLYGSVRQGRIVEVLRVIEQRRRSARNESVSIPSKLDVEHVMPQGWRSHWPLEDPHDVALSSKRDALIHTIGNLTVVTQSLNGTLSHRPWRDVDAAGLPGPEAGLGKRSLLHKHSLLLLNKQIVDDHPDAWTESDIRRRAEELTEEVIAAWPRPQHALDANTDAS